MGTKLRISEGLKLMASRAGKSMAQICRELDMGTPANLVLMVNKETVRQKVAAAMCEVCGYTLMAVPNDEVEKISNGIEFKGEEGK